MVLTRPAVEAGEALGFLPGDLYEKIAPYLHPLHDALQDMLAAEEIQKHTERGVIEIAPLAYMRGRTLNHAFIILDEAQNSTMEQMFMFLTRLGINSKAVITGDETQIDLPPHKHSGLLEAHHALRHTEGITFDYAEGVGKGPCPALLHSEIFICVDEALGQARGFGATWQTELVRYVIHGILHLRGFNDSRPSARHKMKREEGRLLCQL